MLTNPFDKFQLGLHKMLEDLMIQRMSENNRIVPRHMDDKAFEDAAFARALQGDLRSHSGRR
ncbi:MAG: hypothetical protein IDH49_13670 [Gammaproteobacteria bacterium]|nr:hypothetical protein [Gammaproteobacteria bacterium]